MIISRWCPRCGQRHDAATSCLLAALTDRGRFPAEQRAADIAEESGIEEYVRHRRGTG